MPLELAEHEPKPTVITRETIDSPTTEFENWMFGLAYRDPQRARKMLVEWIETLPSYDGPADGSDVLPPGAAPVRIPDYWWTPVHFQPGAFANPKIIRLSLMARTQYTFTREDQIATHLAAIFKDRDPGRILEVGTGTGTTAFAFASLWPNNPIVAVDLAPAYIRFCREWAERRGVTNITFYQQNAQEMVFGDGEFDTVHFTYVLHEMPAAEARLILREMYRVLKPGGTLSAMDALVDDDPEARAKRAARGAAGPEPFLPEYMALNLPKALEEVGFVNVQRPFAYDDGMVLIATKPA